MTLDSTYPQGGFDAAEMWLSALRAAGRSPATLANYRHAVEKLGAWRGDGDVTTLSKFEAMRFVQHLSDTYSRAAWPTGCAACGPASVGCWPRRSSSPTRSPGSESASRRGEDDGQRRGDRSMLARAKGNRRDLALLTLLADTGCRKGEIAALTSPTST